MKTLLEKLANYSFDMLAILDINGNLILANQAFLEKLGCRTRILLEEVLRS